MIDKCYLIDLDGTMYWGTKIIPGAKEFIDGLIKNKIKFVFLTNNASRTQEQCAEHMLKMGFTKIKPEMFYTSAMAASDYVARLYPGKKRAAYIGETGMRRALLDNDFEIVTKDADFLFVGLDRNATYTDYSYALRALKEDGLLVGTNNDRTLLSEKGHNIGNGAVVAMFEYALNTKAIEIGKPHHPIIEGALRYIDEPKSNCIIIGDNLETDIKVGSDAGIDTVLVTTGMHNMSDCFELGIKPTYIVEDLRGLLK